MMSFWLGVEQPELPVAATAADIDGSTEPGLNGFRDHLLQRRIGNKKPLQEAGLLRVRAAELERCRYAVRFRIPGIERHQLRENFVGEAGHRIKTGVG